MHGIIGFEHHQIDCIIGVDEHERLLEQEIYVDVKVEYNFSRCVLTDQICDTIDYTLLAKTVTDLARKRKYKLLESLAYEAVQLLINHFQLSWAWIRIKKPKGLSTAHYTVVEFSQGAKQGAL